MWTVSYKINLCLCFVFSSVSVTTFTCFSWKTEDVFISWWLYLTVQWQDEYLIHRPGQYLLYVSVWHSLTKTRRLLWSWQGQGSFSLYSVAATAFRKYRCKNRGRVPALAGPSGAEVAVCVVLALVGDGDGLHQRLHAHHLLPHGGGQQAPAPRHQDHAPELPHPRHPLRLQPDILY